VGTLLVRGRFPQAPRSAPGLVEADVFPKNKPARWNLIAGTIGEGSPFHSTFGYYAQGVDEVTAVLPAGWKTRLAWPAIPRKEDPSVATQRYQTSFRAMRYLWLPQN
jgi:hypothetical protein